MSRETQSSAKVHTVPVEMRVFDELGDKFPASVYRYPSVRVNLDGSTIFQRDVSTHFWFLGIRKPFFQRRLDRAIKEAEKVAERINHNEQ